MRFLAMLCFFAWMSMPRASAQSKLPDGPGKAALLRVCKGCHPPETVAAKRHTRDEWEEVVIQMINAGATGSDDDLNLVVDYLTEHFNKAAKVNVNKATVSEFVDALGLSSKDGNAIVSFRDKNGAFKTVEDVKKVPGIDTAIIEAKKDQLQF
jgi:competence protein ComEA